MGRLSFFPNSAETKERAEVNKISHLDAKRGGKEEKVTME